VAQFRDTRPAEVVLVKPLKTIIVASERKFLELGLFAHNKRVKLYGTDSDLPYIRKGDVEFRTMPDDSLLIWDLTKEITDKTVMSDLYIIKKVARLQKEKEWEDGYKPKKTQNTGNNNWNNNNKTHTEVKTQNAGTTEASSSKDITGMVWNPKLNKYKTQVGMSKSKEMDSVIIDVDNLEIIELSEADEVKGSKADDKVDTGNSTFEEIEASKMEQGTCSNIKVDEVKEAAIEKMETGAPTPEPMGEVIKLPARNKKTIELEAAEEAKKFVDEGLERYENDDEVAADLEVSNPIVLAELPLFTLANRIKKYVFERGFIAGYTANKDGVKSSRASKKIRSMKIVLRILSKIVGFTTQEDSEILARKVRKATDSVTTKGVVDIHEVFTAGDFREMPVLRKIAAHSGTQEK
jgi:predicted DNA-binding protein (UPF0251 family)